MTELGEEHYPLGASASQRANRRHCFDKALGEPIWEFFAKKSESLATL
jgi:hypothetical protein